MIFLRTLALIVRRSLRLHAVGAAVTAFSVALGCGLMIAVSAIQTQTYNAFTDSPQGFDAVLGARGSKLQLVLNSLFHLDRSTGNIPWSLYERVRDDPAVRRAVPIAVGDNIKGFRLVGTSLALFDAPTGDAEDPDFTPLTLQAGSRLFDESRREAVVGAFAARSLGLRIGSEIHSHHGLSEESNQRHEHGYTVVGILKTSNTPADRALFIPIEGYWRMEGHALYGSGERYTPQPGQPIPDEHKQVSAVLLSIHSAAGRRLDRAINIDSTEATLAWPTGQIVANLFDKVAWAHRVLELVARIVTLVAAGAILAGLYNTMHQRRRQLAILRALGATRIVLFSVVLAEAVTIAVAGIVLGFLVYVILATVAAQSIQAQVGIAIDPYAFDVSMVQAPLIMLALSVAAGLAPAFKAYTTDVGANLSPTT